MENKRISERVPVNLMYKIMFFLFIATAVAFSTAQAGEKKKAVGAKTVAKINRKAVKIEKKEAAKVPAASSSARPQAQRPVAGGRMPASLSAGVSDSQKSLEIRGQSRNLSMLLVLKNRHENIDFVKPRETYRDEISKTDF
jgi:hypothetical protein